MRQQLNYTCMLKNLLKLYCIWTWDTLWCLFCFVLCCFLFISPLMRQRQNYFWDTISKIGGSGISTKIIKTEILLHLNLEIFFIYIFFIFIYLFYFSFSILCLSNACSAYCWLGHYLSLFISLKLLFVCFVFFYLFVFPFFLTSLLSTSSHPSILNITIVIITS
jgi:hypothetical protein